MKLNQIQNKKLEEEKKEEQVEAINEEEEKKVDHQDTSSKDIQKPTKKKRILGTADYMAPEVIKGDPADALSDFWSVGIIAYEFLTGNLPFNDDSPVLIFNNILNKEIEWPETCESEEPEPGKIHPTALDFIQKLLVKEPSERLGEKHGIQELKNHPFLRDVNWGNLINEVAPWLPGGKDGDAANFPNAKSEDYDHMKQIIQEETQADYDNIRQEANQRAQALKQAKLERNQANEEELEAIMEIEE